MPYLSPVYAMFHLFGYKILIQLKAFSYYRINPSEQGPFKIEIPIQVFLFKVSNILMPFDKIALETAFLLVNL